jgi:hypothetical protein
VNATSQIIGATHRRECLSRKRKDAASNTLGEQTKKQHDTLESCELDIVSTSNNL